MPELPEVETTLRGIAPHVLGKTVRAVVVRQPRLRWRVPAALARELPDRPSGASSAAENICCSRRGPRDGDTASRHVRQPARGGRRRAARQIRSCRYRVRGRPLPAAARPAPVRRAAVDARAGDIPLLAHLGPEPLEAEFDGGYLFRRTRRGAGRFAIFYSTDAWWPASATSTPTRRCSPPACARRAPAAA